MIVNRRRLPISLFLVALLAAATSAAHAASPCTRTEVLFDQGWKFHLGDAPGGEQPSADDHAWRTLSLPHDWAIESGADASNPSGGAGAFAPMGIGWYRKHLPTPAISCVRTVIQFDGVMANSDVWLNGHLLGHRPNGYVTFRYDLTPFLNSTPGADNVLAVRADNSQQPSSRFYQGAGIYRHVHLQQLPLVHVEGWSTVVASSNITHASATLRIATVLRNDDVSPKTAGVVVTVFDATGRAIAHTTMAAASIPAGATSAYTATLSLPHPHLWNLDDPALYRVHVDAVEAGRHGDSEVVTFGVRDAHFDAATGFWLNGKNIKIKGVALHSDIGALGMAAPLSLWEHRLRAMQAMGANAIRTAHNPVAPELLDLCDRMGILVLDEFFDTWTVAKNRYDYHLYFRDWYLKETRDTVRRDRNHPSIIAWSAGNEIHDTPHPEIAKPILASLVAAYHEEDPTRPVTQALFRPNASHDYDDGLADLLDVIGQNYRPNEILAAHEAKPTRRILGTENIHDRATWLAVRDNPPYSGMFLWAGVDYLGESRHWPLFADASGMNDRTDYPKPDSLERESWWADHPVVHVVRRVALAPKAPTDPGYELEQYRPKPTALHDWTPADSAPHTEHVEVYSNCKEVALQFNGSSLGSKSLNADASPRVWEVSFRAGALEARCTDHPAVVETLRTAGPPSALRLTLEGSEPGRGFDDVARVRLMVVDSRGVPVPGAVVPVAFSSTGAGSILATDDADYSYSAPFSSTQRSTYDGRALVLLRGSAAGEVHLLAKSPGLTTADLTLHVH
ncbi:beta-galactosidase [Bryocella elongata]|uniref:Beta-galactosidase n=1 Tax=Bryocella elongata TaxID=863522 RepID=A0A1H5XUT3_9BACT|nr:glycoside hydrolase family 2 TIM barrel-domain containing protein [Bryocella elongata]SEG15491.1 beta-galactosidase [Bryocella elongata]